MKPALDPWGDAKIETEATGSADYDLHSVGENLPSAQSLVTNSLRQAIIAGHLKPGTNLKVRTLAAQLGVSTMPVRQALSVLQSEGYISHEHHRAFRVIPATLKEAETLYLLRVRLEPLAAELVAAHHTDADLRLLCDLAARMDAPVEQDDFERYALRDWAFHDAVYAVSRRPRLIEFIQQARRAALRYRRLYDAKHRSRAEMRQTQSEHLALVEAVARHDAATAGQMIAAGLNRWISGLREEL